LTVPWDPNNISSKTLNKLLSEQRLDQRTLSDSSMTLDAQLLLVLFFASLNTF